MEHNEILTVGIGGIRPIFYYEDLKDINPNSLLAIEIVYIKLLNQYGNEFKALKHYKRAKKNLSSVYRTIEVKNKIKGLL